MQNLDMTNEKAKRMSEIEAEAIEVIGSVILEKRDFDETASTAMKFLNVVAKNRQTLTAREGIRFNMAQSIAANPSELAAYIAASSPEIKKAITGKINANT